MLRIEHAMRFLRVYLHASSELKLRDAARAHRDVNGSLQRRRDRHRRRPLSALRLGRQWNIGPILDPSLDRCRQRALGLAERILDVGDRPPAGPDR